MPHPSAHSQSVNLAARVKAFQMIRERPSCCRVKVESVLLFYLYGPPSFLQSMRDGLPNWRVLAENVHTEIFGALEAITPGMAQVLHTPHPRKDSRDLVLQFHRAQRNYRRLGSEICELA